MTAPDLHPDVAAALACTALAPRGFRVLTSVPTGRRLAYRVDLRDGRTIKARVALDEKTARALVALRAELPDDFARVLDRHGAVLLEEWIDGEPLGPRPDNTRLVAAATLLAALHGRTSVAGARVHERHATAAWHTETDAGLAALVAAGLLADGDARALRAALARFDPGSAVTGLVHRDFCGENMIVDGAGRLRVIDNERLGVDALGYDVGRTWYRWALPPDAWERFAAAYAAAAPFSEPLATVDFWRIVAAVKSARVRLRAGVGIEVPLGCLRRLARASDG